MNRPHLAEWILERPEKASRGGIFLIHGSAPFNIDGKVPSVGGGRYSRHCMFKDVASGLRSVGWSVLRYSKPGVSRDHVDQSVYATTDLDCLTQQIIRLFRHLPRRAPRIVFAFSEGTLHVQSLPLTDLDGVIMLGSIATNISDVVKWQGGPSREDLLRELSGMNRIQMVGIDRPVGRLIDEVHLSDNWRVFKAYPDLPILILHGAADKEVPLEQAWIWQKKLPRHRLTVAIGDGLDHCYMPPRRYDPGRLVGAVREWLDQTFGGTS